MDESVELVDASQMSTEEENKFLRAIMLGTPVIPISQWFEPELQLPHQIHSQIAIYLKSWDAVERLAEQRIFLNA